MSHTWFLLHGKPAYQVPGLRVCQGFTYDSNTKVATFKGQMPQQAIDVATEATPAVNVSLWWLNAGKYLAQHEIPFAVYHRCCIHTRQSFSESLLTYSDVQLLKRLLFCCHAR